VLLGGMKLCWAEQQGERSADRGSRFGDFISSYLIGNKPSETPTRVVGLRRYAQPSFSHQSAIPSAPHWWHSNVYRACSAMTSCSFRCFYPHHHDS
jgi:hypothetical protein